jgi:hypothetical protein
VSPVLHKLALVVSAIRPVEVALPVHFVVLPSPDVDLAIVPLVDPMPVDFIISEFSFVGALVCEVKSSPAFLLPLDELPHVFSPVLPLFNPDSVLPVVLPLAFVGALIRVSVLPQSVGFIIPPLPLINISICVDQLPEPIRLVVLPSPDVFSSICPLLDAQSVTFLLVIPLSCVARAVR